MSEGKADTVPGLGFKDKEKAEETLKNLEGRDPDYQKLAVKGLIGRAKRVLTLTKDKEKLQNINTAMSIFDEFLKNYEKKNLGKENRPYLPLDSIKTLLPLKSKYSIEDKLADDFLEAYKKVKGEYKNLRTASSGEDKPTWDIVRNAELKKLVKKIDDESPDMWDDDDLPTKEHMQLILWAYSSEATKIKKNLSKLEEKLGKPMSDEEEEKNGDGKADDKSEDKDGKKRKSDSGSGSGSSSDSDESPKKKSKN